MDPFTAVGLAGNIIQFLDFTSKLIDTGLEVSRSGGTAENHELQNIATDFEILSRKLSNHLRPEPGQVTCASPEDQVFVSIFNRLVK
jgi:hypothetical protein